MLNDAVLAIDCETTGLMPHDGDTLFGFSLANHEVEEFHTRGGLSELRELAKTPRTWLLANAKFDLAFFEKEGVLLTGRIWDVLVMERLVFNDYISYSLESCGKRIGYEKSDKVEKYIKTHQLYTRLPNGDKRLHLHKVPLDILAPYAKQDARVTYELYRRQVGIFRGWDKTPIPAKPLVQLEMNTTLALYEMEKQGVRVDTDYCTRALNYELTRTKRLDQELTELCAKPFVDSGKFLKAEFDSRGIPYGKTEKGNASFTEDVLAPHRQTHRLVDLVLKRRESLKRAETYFANFLKFTGSDSRIHPSIRQVGAATGRMSITNPAAQTWPAEDHSEYPVRRSFIADEDCQILSMDFAQMEVRLAADEAEDTVMIEKIESGADVHQEVADMAQVRRGLAKNGRFARQYGGGEERIAITLGCDMTTASRIVKAIDASQPGITAYSYALRRQAKTSPYIYNWMGRRYYFTDKSQCYKAPNYRIQGGCADILRVAILNCSKVLQGKKSKLILPIHDELVFNLHNSEHYLIPLLRDAMICAYRTKKRLSMDVSVSIGPNFHDLKEWTDGEEARNEVQGEGSSVSQDASALLVL